MRKLKKLNCVLGSHLTLKSNCKKCIEVISEFRLPSICPRVLTLTDGGPDVGISNYEQRYRDAELARIQRSDYRIKIHRSCEDSGQNQAERTDSGIGDAIVDGDWEIIKRFKGVSPEEKKTVTFDQFCNCKFKRMEKNAWGVAKEIRDRLDDAPVMGEYVKSFLTDEEDKGFFYGHQYPKSFIENRNKNSQTNVPGYHYFKKIQVFIDNRYKVGDRSGVHKRRM